MTKVAILANGTLQDPDQVRTLAAQAGFLVTADGGSRHAKRLGLRVDVVVGDLDSLTESERQALQEAGTTLLPHPAEKDETDLELALLEAVRRGAEEIVILAALGGRTDQTLANLLLLALPELAGARCCIVEGKEAVFLVQGGIRIVGRPGDLLSLIPIGGDCRDIWTEGLKYALAGEPLHLARARGISNVFTAGEAVVRVGQGMLLAVHRAQAVRKSWPCWSRPGREDGTAR